MSDHYVTRGSLNIDLFLLMVVIGVVMAITIYTVLDNADRIEVLEQRQEEVLP